MITSPKPVQSVRRHATWSRAYARVCIMPTLHGLALIYGGDATNSEKLQDAIQYYLLKGCTHGRHELPLHGLHLGWDTHLDEHPTFGAFINMSKILPGEPCPIQKAPAFRLATHTTYTFSRKTARIKTVNNSPCHGPFGSWLFFAFRVLKCISKVGALLAVPVRPQSKNLS